jgi:hypothetical protein
VSRLLACPFCREMFDQAEASECPHCEIALEPIHRLRPSIEESEREAQEWEQTRADDVRLAWTHLGHARGPLLAIALVGLLAFWFAPWVRISSPYDAARTGYSLASGPLGWLWGGAVAWCALIALVASRRSLAEMRGVRAITMLFAAATATEIAMLVFTSPTQSNRVQFVYEWAWGLYVALGSSIAGIVLGWCFGGTARTEAEGPRRRAPPLDSATLH